jgi:hypothetical protein
MSNFFTKLTSAMGVATLVVVSTGASLVSAASEFAPYAEVLADNGVITAQSTEAGYNLGNNITRAEIAKVVANLGGIESVTCSGTVYSDVPTSNSLCGYVEALADAGVVSTASATFRPGAQITRAEMVKMILGALGETPSSTDAGYMDVAGLGDLAGYVNRANEIGCVNSSSYFRPNASSSRGEAFKVAVVCAGLDVNPTPTPTPTPTGTGGTATGTVAGALTVALEGQAMAQYVPYNASSVKVGTVKLTAGTSDVTVSSVVVSRSGLGPVTDISSLVLAQNGSNVSDSRTMSTSSQTATLKFTTPLMLKAGSSAMVDILVNLNGASNSQHQFAVTTVNALNGATVSGLPVTLGLLNTTSYGVATLTVDSITTSSVTSGKANQLFATVKLTPGKAAQITGFTLTKGTGEDYTKVLSNVSAYFNGTKVGSVAVTTDKVMVTGLSIDRLSGEQASVELRGDIVYVGAASTTTFRVDSSSDVSAIEKTTGYSTTVTGAPTLDQPLTLSSVDLTITKTSTGTRTVAPGTSVDLYNATITSDASFDVSNYTMSITSPTVGVNGLSAFTDNKVTVYVNGVDYEIVNQTGATSSRTWTASADRFRVEPGTTVNIRVTANVRSNATPVPADYVATFSIAQVKNVSNGNVSAVTKSQAGDKVTVKNGTATLKNATVAPPSTRRVYSNADLEIGRFAVGAEAENVTVRKITLTNAAVATGVLTPVTDWTTIISGNSVKLVDVATNAQISATVTVTAGSIVIDSMSAEVIKDSSRNFKVVATTSGFDVTQHNKNIDLSVVLNTVDKSSGGAATLVGSPLASVSTTDYVTGVVPPSVSITKKSAKVFLVKVTNTDSNTDITLNAIKARVKPVAVNNSTYTATYCLRSEGSSTSTCPEATTSTGTGGVPGVAANLMLATAPTITKNGGSYSYEILVDSNYVDPTDLLGEVLQLTYQGSSTEDYQVSAQ